MFKTAARKIAHNSTLPALGGNKDLRPLQDLINAEKAVLISLQKLSVDFSKSSEAIRAWGLGEGDDLGDILSGSTSILAHFSSALSQYAAHGHNIRENLKAIRTREEALDDLKRRRRSVMGEADSAERKLSKMSPEHKNLAMQTETLNRLRDEIRTMDSDIMTEEAALGDFKRSMTKNWMGLKFGGLLECCEKGAIAGDYGKLVISEISEEITQPGLPRSIYYGHGKTESLVAEAHRSISEVQFSTVPTGAPREPRHFEQQFPNLPEPQSNPPNSAFTQTNFYPGGDGLPPLPISTNTWATRQSHDLPPSATDYLPAPQGLGSGRFIDTPEPSITGSPNLSYTAPRMQTQSDAPAYSPIDPPRHTIPERTVDDFGVTSSHTVAGPVDTSDTAGGRFATFPVKTRPLGSAGGYALRDGPPSLASRHEGGLSLSQSIADALGPGAAPEGPEQKQQQAITKAQEVAHDTRRRQSIDVPAPAYELDGPRSAASSSGFATAPLPPGAAPPAQASSEYVSSWGLPPHPGHERTGSGDDALLAYMTSEDPQLSPVHQQQHDTAKHDHEHEKHVRFGRVSDVDEEMESREREMVKARDTPQQQQEPKEVEADVVGDAPHITTTGPKPVIEEHQPQPQSQPQSQPQLQEEPRAPSPMLSPEEEERALNAAAAREISRELDALNFSPPKAMDTEFKAGLQSQREASPERGRQQGSLFGYNNTTGEYPQPIQREPSPLLPPVAPFTKRAISPHPYAELNPGPTPPSPSYAPAQAYAQSYQGSSPYAQGLPQSPAQQYAQSYQAPGTYGQTPNAPYESYSPPESHTPPPNPLPPRFQALQQSPSMNSEPKNPLPPRFQAALSQPPPPSPHDGQPSPSNPLPPRFQNLSQQNLSQPSLVSDMVNTPGTSPYRTPPEYPRSLSITTPTFAKSTPSLGSPVTTPGTRTISAAAFKRPAPRKTSIGDGALSDNSSPLMIKKRLPSSPYPQGQQRSGTVPPEGISNTNSSISVGGGRELPAPPPQAHSGDTEDEYDYISAYVNSESSGSPQKDYFGGVKGPGGDEKASGGYGEGRFATDLEGGGLR